MRIVTYMETYSTQISDVINVKVVKEVETSDLIKMDETEIACILDKNEFWENNTENLNLTEGYCYEEETLFDINFCSFCLC